MKQINSHTKHNNNIIYDTTTSAKIRYVFRRALTILKEREEKSNRPIDWHKMDWRITEMKPMATIAFEQGGSGISVPAETNDQFKLQFQEALMIVRSRLKSENVYYIEAEDLFQIANGDRTFGFRKTLSTRIPS